MNYRHGFHAGNIADVHKHVVLLAILDHLTAKPAPFCYLDTHAGRGAYDLRGDQAGKSEEWRDGIGRLLDAKVWQQQPDLTRYVTVLGRLGVDAAAPLTYPGSPLLAAAMMRAPDRAVLVEKQPDEARALRVRVGRRKHTSVICGDGYHELKAQLPPRERRGLVLLDPAYESSSEYADLAQALIAAHARWPTGIYMAWYPIKAGNAAQSLLEALRASPIRRVLRCELTVRPRDAAAGLNGSGLVIVNPPWQLDQRALEIQAELARILAPDGRGGSIVDWVVPE